jgi:hypothetical protein
MLLGRPWLYDRKVQYDRYTNTYLFLFKGRKLVLQPMKVDDFGNSQQTEYLVLTLQKFTSTCKERGLIFLVVARQELQPRISSPPVEIQALLDEFSYIIPNELPKVLPHMCKIQHAIDLIPGATLPNL